MALRRPSGFRPGFNRYDRREAVGLKPENALSRVARTFPRWSLILILLFPL